MSTSLLYHAFRLDYYKYLNTKYIEGAIFFNVQPRSRLIYCPICGDKHIVRKGIVKRKLRAIPIGMKKVWVIVNVPRVFCKLCKKVRQIKLKIAGIRRSYTKQFERFVLSLSRITTIKGASEHANISWDIVKDIQKRFLAKKWFIRLKRTSWYEEP